MTEILQELPIPKEVKNSILGEDKQGLLSQVLGLIVNYEQSKWDTVAEIASSLKLQERVILEHYLVAIKWANDCSF